MFSKVLANRLKKLLLIIITKYQSAFAKNRLISDNILIAFETLHHMNSHNLGDTSFMALKLYMSKAYDQVEWGFLEDIMQQMGFNERWIRLILICVKIVLYSILVNGEPKVMIHPTRGIHQGEPFVTLPLPSLY